MDKEMGISPFEAPVVITADKRLTLETMRVLMALYWFRADKPWPVPLPERKNLSAVCKIHPSNISHATKKLSEFGWLKKDGAFYTLTIPEVIPEMARLNKERAKAQKDAMKRPRLPASTRRFVFERDSYRCVKCNSHMKLCVDHKYPYSLGGSNETNNLQTLCWKCNSKKGNKIEATA